MIERISKVLFVSDPRLFSIGALRSGVISKRDAHCRALPIRATFHVIDKRRHHRNVQKTERKPISIGNDANNWSMKVVLTNAMSTQCSVGMKKEKTSSTHAHAVRTKKAVLRKVVLSPTKYWRQYCNPHGRTSRMKFGISVEAQEKAEAQENTSVWRPLASESFLSSSQRPSCIIIIFATSDWQTEWWQR